MTRPADTATSLDLYTEASERAAARIIGLYSTSFGMATRLLGPRHRRHVRNIYALVRIADELVDGVAEQAGASPESQHAELDRLEAETMAATASGYSSNPIVHAFAGTARAAGIDEELTAPFFASMRTDLPPRAVLAEPLPRPRGLLRFGDEAHASYVYGSAEVAGMMCLRVFLRDEHRTDDELAVLEHGARRLGAAFQNVNFLRDLADDTGRLGRSYLSAEGEIGAHQQQRWVSTIRQQLADAEVSLPLLPADARTAVRCALTLFARLTERIAATPASQLYRRRVRVPASQKAWVVLRTVVIAGKERIA